MLLETVFEEDPEHTHAIQDAGTIYEALGEYSRSASVWRQYLEARPVDSAAARTIQRLELMARSSQEGLDPKREAAALKEIGAILVIGDEFERARGFFAQAIEKDSADPEI